MLRRASALALAALTLAAVALAGCTPVPSPTPTPAPSFASDAEAFAAAEATYRAYVDALNRVDLADPPTFEDVYSWTTGDANAEDRRSFSRMHADGLTVRGDSAVDLFERRPDTPLSASVCLDVSRVELFDSSGASAVDPDRGDVQRMKVSFEKSDISDTGLRISSITGRSDGTPCE
ncbi:hypothetical protein ABCS02_25635 [Microbacterium sp. X-17]|uniref:hypothetical protein n=1 Tax=Microbacterium sp. X-17 TaxID=3144404 RepID=UPI0031F4EB57